MEHKVLAPQVGESITEVRILRWVKKDGDIVKAGENLLEIETDKATVDVGSESAGLLKILKAEGEVVKVGDAVATVDDTKTQSAGGAQANKPSAPPSMAPPAHVEGGARVNTASTQMPDSTPNPPRQEATAHVVNDAGPAARKVAEERGVDLSKVSGTGKDGRPTKADVWDFSGKAPAPTPPPSAPAAPLAPAAAKVAVKHDRPGDRRSPMTRLRLRIAERLVQAQHEAAILTTFNEVDLSNVMKIRSEHKDHFKQKHNVNLSFMSFFSRAVVLSLQAQPTVNASIDGTDVVHHDYYDIGIAVGTDRGLVVPVLRNVENMNFVDIERGIGALAVKARDGKLSIPEMTGGTFTITNGGTYGSLLSTPILNPPQSGILGMHKIQERPIAVDGQVVIRPMMYVALSYDHRLIDGKEAVTFLVALKNHLEKPETLGFIY